MESNNRDTPVLVRELLKKATQLGVTEEALCHRLGLSHSHFSRWRTGLRSSPDPRNPTSRKFYQNAAEFLGKSVGEVMSYVIFADKGEEQEFSDWIFSSILDKKKSVPVPELSEASKKLLHELIINIPGREEFLEVLSSSLRTYVTKVRFEDWYEDAQSAIRRYRELNLRYGAAYRMTMTGADAPKRKSDQVS